MVVIPFPGSSQGRPSPRPRGPAAASAPAMSKPLGVTVEAALKVHAAIVDGLRSGVLQDRAAGAPMALTDLLCEQFGHGGISWAEMQFEIIYGVDPYTFSEHLAAYRPGGTRVS
ncbi:MAG: hypothetical protein IPM60_05470 [Rhodospirillales bacterium]|nr:hypothetical protein [Rhodospirillales bacterium]